MSGLSQSQFAPQKTRSPRENTHTFWPLAEAVRTTQKSSSTTSRSARSSWMVLTVTLYKHSPRMGKHRSLHSNINKQKRTRLLIMPRGVCGRSPHFPARRRGEYSYTLIFLLSYSNLGRGSGQPIHHHHHPGHHGRCIIFGFFISDSIDR